MSIDFRLRQTVTILNPGSKTDEYNNTVPDWDNPTTTIEKGLLEPTQSTEITVGRDTIISDFLLFLKTTSAITALSRVQVAGVTGTFEVVGLPGLFDQGNAGTKHIEARLRTFTG